MKKSWTTVAAEIKRELIFLISRHTPLTFCQHGGRAIKAHLHDIASKEDNLLVLDFDQNCKLLEGQAIIFYQVPQQPLQGFETNIIREENDKLLVAFPDEIFRVERRRLSRIKTLGNSMVSFMIDGKTQLASCNVKDISVEGAQLISKSRYEKESKLSPLTFNLGMRYEAFEKVVIVSEATIVRITERKDGLLEYGVHFNAGNADQDKLEQYILIRSKEDRDLESN
jgi:c-di-GMP-binding flagellar brake protein YcgR